MPIRSRRFGERALALAGAAVLLSAFVLVTRASSSPPPMESDFRAAYPRTPVLAGSYAGVEIDRLSLPGLRLSAREDHAVDDGGIVLSFADAKGEVRALVTLAVANDAAGARRFVDEQLHGVAVVLPSSIDPALGDYAFADDGGRGAAIVVGAAANLAWVARSFDDGLRASTVVAAVRALAVAGAPSLPSVSVALDPEVSVASGGAVRVVAPPGRTAKLRAEGAYVAHSKSGPIVRPFAPGPVAVHATLVDELGRVGVAKAIATAK